MIVRFMDAGFIVAADDHVGHGKYAGCPADGRARKLASVFCDVVPYDKGAHAVAEQEIGKLRIFLTYQFSLLCTDDACDQRYGMGRTGSKGSAHLQHRRRPGKPVHKVVPPILFRRETTEHSTDAGS